MDAVGVYVHVPFCAAKCHYCDFAAYSGLRHLIDHYIAALIVEVEGLAPRLGLAKLPEARTLFFGGGTPSLLEARHFAAILRAMPPRLPNAEITVEANPATVGSAWLADLRSLGVNRLSLGVQCFDDHLLRRLGRLHSAVDAVASYDLARARGFDNISLDLIYGLPGQDLVRWQATLRHALELAPEHLSLYPLTIEERTVFGRDLRRGTLEAPGQDTQADMFLAAVETLGAAGYEHYEISNWAREGFRARHNLVYWRNEPYIGLGASAHSYFDRRRFANVAHPRKYVDLIRAGHSAAVYEETIDTAGEIGETLMMGLRLAEGISHDTFARRFGLRLADIRGDTIRELVALGLLLDDGGRVALTTRGRLLGNEVFCRFLGSGD